VSDEKLWDESPTSRHLQVLYHQTSFQEEHLKDISTKTDGNEMFLCKAARYRSQTKLTRHMTLKLKYILHPKRDDC